MLNRSHTPLAAVAVVAAGLFAASAQAAVIYSQTPPSNVDAYESDRNIGVDGYQQADNLTLASSDVARSATWRGQFVATSTPVVPISFDLIFYADNGSNLPDENNVLSSTTVSFASGEFTNTGIIVDFRNVYEFQANLTPTALTGGTQVWFSVLANTNNDVDDNFYWTTGLSGDPMAQRTSVAINGPFIPNTFGPFYFVLDNATILPEPASLSLLALGGLMTLRRRRI